MQSGIGLANVKKRLKLLYPNDHQLEIIENETFLIKLNRVRDKFPAFCF